MTLSRYRMRLLAGNAQRLAERRDALSATAAAASESRLFRAGLLLALAAVALALGGGYHAGFRLINGSASTLPERLLQIVTYCGDTNIALLVALVCARRYPQILWLSVLAALAATLGSHVLKNLLSMPRPPALLPADALHIIGPAYRGHSFPSGHTVTAFVTAGVLGSFTGPRRRALLLAAALLVGGSRVAVGVHWPVDVLAGAALGLLSVALALRCMRRWEWGLRPQGHHLLVLLLCGAAIGELLRRAPYPEADHVGDAFAVIALFLALRDYALRPLLAAAPAPATLAGSGTDHSAE